MNAVLELRGLSVAYGAGRLVFEAVKGLTLSLVPGERLGLVGESGSGKTTTALAILGMLRAPGRISSGSILLEGRELVGLGPEEQRRLRLAKISYVPQGAMNSLNPVQRVRRSLADAIRAHEDAAPVALDARIQALLAEVGLPPDVADRYPHQLSGGMKQRVCIALAISLSPRVIIADEPTSALDVVTQRQVMHTLHRAQERHGSALVLIGHDMGLMAQSVGRIAVMRNGELQEEGPTRAIFRRPVSPYTAELIRSVPMVGSGGIAARGSSVSMAATHGNALLEFDRVSKVYPGRFGSPPLVALHELSMRLPADDARIVAIVGQSGSGKTTLGSLALGFTQPSTGIIRYDGRDLRALRGEARRRFRRGVQAVFQDPYSTFNPFYRVARSLTLPLRQFRLASGADEARAMAEAACRQIGLDPARLLNRFPHELSGGQRQRLMVARALLLRPRLLIADEPVSMVDASLRATILDLLVQLRDQHGIGILYITHDLATAWRVADEVLVLHKGRVVEAGAPGPVLQDPRHPYTRLLMDSLPWPDPDRGWGTIAEQATLQREVDEAPPRPPILRSASMLDAHAAEHRQHTQHAAPAESR